MRTKDFILNTVRKSGGIRTSDVVKRLRLSRQTAAQHLRELVASKTLTKLGSTIDSKYVPFRKHSAPSRHAFFATIRSTKGLEEGAVFAELDLRLKLKQRLSKAAYHSASYGFTEMLNNAIEHSGAKKVSIRVFLSQRLFSFGIVDRGVGVFENVRRKFKFKNHYEAVEHLLKGKQTTDPKCHSGQGIFFTSKVADRFTLKSARVDLLIDNTLEDYFVKDLPRFHEGTLVHVEIKPQSRRELKKIFDEYSTSQYEFDRTTVNIRLSPSSGPYVSRSEARRLTLGLEKFRSVTLDFKGVEAIGQGFADEIFRVFQQKHPSIRIEALHMMPAVEFMVKRGRG